MKFITRNRLVKPVVLNVTDSVYDPFTTLTINETMNIDAGG